MNGPSRISERARPADECRHTPNGANRAAQQFLQKDTGAPVKGVTLGANVSGEWPMERRVYTAYRGAIIYP
jgi:hypothetical protein